MVHIFDNFVRERENNYKNNISLKIVKDERMKSKREGKNVFETDMYQTY